MMTTLRWCRIALKLIFLLLFWPLILLWLGVRMLIYRRTLKRTLIQQGVPHEAAKALCREMVPF